MKNTLKNNLVLGAFVLLLINTSCEKFLEAPLPKDKLTYKAAYSSKTTIKLVMEGVYSKASSYYGSGNIIQTLEPLADNIKIKIPNTIDLTGEGAYNAETATFDKYWSAAYAAIAETNGMLENLPTNTAGLSTSELNNYIAQNKFLRALMHFELVRLWGDVPLILTTNPSENLTKARTPKAEVLAQVITDLKDAYGILPATNFSGGTNYYCANKYVVQALLARVYLWMNDYANAETSATDVITNGGYTLETDITRVLLRNSNESIFAYNGSNESFQNFIFGAIYLYPAAWPMIPMNGRFSYINTGCFTSSLLAEFEADDQRGPTASIWVGRSKEGNYFTLKYARNFYDQAACDADPQDFCILRLAEMHLIRAEARAKKASPDLAGAANDVWQIRKAHGGFTTLPVYATAADAITAIEHENRVEFFTENHRWYDLVRTGRADAVLTAVGYKKGWAPYKVLLPVPKAERIKNLNLKQNDGY